MKPRFVYFIKPIGMDGPIKIGCSAMVDGRCLALAFWSPFPLEVVAQIYGDERLESRFHNQFKHLHERQEWFSAAPELIETIASVKAGTFNVDTLPEKGLRVVVRNVPPWTHIQKSLTNRVGHAESKSGYRCPVAVRDAYRDERHDDIVLIEKFLSAPTIFGEPIDSAWAEKARQGLAA